MRFGTIIRGMAMLLSLNNCGSLPAPDSSAGSKSGEPAQIENTPIAHKFRVGDYFTFDNPTTRWQVASVTGDWVLWRGGNGDWQVTGLNPLLPARQWWSRKRGNGRRNIRDRKGTLFPMKVGASVRFRATVTSTVPPFGWEQNWTCRVTGRETVGMLDEVFETFIVVCGDENSNEMTFNYAPKVGHYVMQRISATADSPARTRKLLAYKHADGLFVAENTAAFQKPSSMPIGKSPNFLAIAPAGKNASPPIFSPLRRRGRMPRRRIILEFGQAFPSQPLMRKTALRRYPRFEMPRIPSRYEPRNSVMVPSPARRRRWRPDRPAPWGRKWRWRDLAPARRRCPK